MFPDTEQQSTVTLGNCFLFMYCVVFVCLFIALFTYSFHQLIMEASRCHVSVLSGRLMSAAGERATGSTFIPQRSDVAVISQGSDMLLSFHLFPFVAFGFWPFIPLIFLSLLSSLPLFSWSLCRSCRLLCMLL